MFPGRELRNDTAIPRMQIDLGARFFINKPLAIKHGEPRIITGTLNAQNHTNALRINEIRLTILHRIPLRQQIFFWNTFFNTKYLIFTRQR